MIILEVALLVLNGFAAGKLTALELFWPFVRPGGGVLGYYLIYFIAAVVVAIIAQSSFKRRDRIVFFVAAAAVSIVVLTAAARQVAYRSVESRPDTDNDGVVQSVAAARFLLQGKNPYDTNYARTDFGYFPSPAGAAEKNLADDHYAYPPLHFLLMLPTVWLNDRWGTQFDVQLLYFVLFLLYGALIMSLAKTWTWRTRLLLLSIGNPWLWTLALAGFNDILYVLLLVAAAVCAFRRWPLAASALFGLALVSKQTVWLLIPLWAAFFWWAFRQESPRRRWRWLALTAAVPLVIMLPFFLWNPGAMYDDLVRYVSGVIPGSYPVSGHTTMQLFRTLGVVSSPWDVVPAWPAQLAVGGGILALALRALRRGPTASAFLVWAGTLLLGVTLVSRFAPDNYFLATFEIFLAAYALALAETKPTPEA